MGRLRLKLSQRKSGKLHQNQQGKMTIVKSNESLPFPPSSHHKQQQKQQQQQLQLPRIPYIRCGFLQGKTPKVLPDSSRLPQSPVNKKAVDISFPCTVPPPKAPARQASVPVTPLPKKWLTLGCDPCKQQRSLLHEDYKVVVSSAAAGQGCSRQSRRAATSKSKVSSSSSPPAAPAAAGVCTAPKRGELWQQEMCWKVVARSENEVVRKRVVLQKKSSTSPLSTCCKAESDSSKKQRSRFLDEVVSGVEGPVGRNSYESSFRSGAEVPVYKLMTTSPDQSMENDSFYAWEKDLSPFASESSIFTSFDSPSIMNIKTGNSRMLCASPENRKSVSSRYVINTKPPSPGKDGRKSPQPLNWSASPPLVPAQFDQLQSDPEAHSKSWERLSPCPSPMNIDEDTVLHNVERPAPPPRQRNLEYLCNEERESKHATKDKRKQKYQAFTSRVMESFAVEKTSVNPYKDFRESMIEMILKKDLLQHSDLEELLRSYLILNNAEFHDLIVRVFTDLWYQLFCYDSS